MGAPLTGRRVLITGVSAGIGKASVRAFLREGAAVCGVARSRQGLDALESELGTADRLTTIVADVTDAESMQAMVDQVLADGGVPDIVVANAGIGLDARFCRTSDEAIRSVFEVNVFGVLRTVRPFIRGMTERGSGRVLLISSIVGKRGTPHYAAYSGSKFALHGMADALRVELWKTGVTVGLVCPASTMTEFQRRLLREGPAQKLKRPRRHSAESVADAIVTMARSRKREKILSAEAKLLHLANTVTPGLVDRLLARMLKNKGSST
jgi:short-subunit dehydrogenase